MYKGRLAHGFQYFELGKWVSRLEISPNYQPRGLLEVQFRGFFGTRSGFKLAHTLETENTRIQHIGE